MDRDRILEALGNTELSVRETIRPIELAKTVAAPSDPPPRQLPQLSVDLAAPKGRSVTRTTTPDIEVIGVIGEGGMGRVLLARQHSLSRDVAVKTARDDTGVETHDAILAEGAVVGRLEHPAIVPVHALGLDAAGRPALIMKRIEGVGWSELLADPSHEGWEGWEGDPSDRLPGHLAILRSICNALHFAHSRGVVHRDVKPDNVLIGRFGDVYLADWGVATEIGAREERVCGTPGYMAPEMVVSQPVDARTDVYLLGAVLHQLLTGKMRHERETVSDAVLAACASVPYEYGSEVPRELAELANRACDADPALRPASAQAFRDAIADYLRHRDAAALAAEARERRVRLDALLAIDAPDEAQRRDTDRLVAEVRFGLEQALSRWQDNDELREEIASLDARLDERRGRAAALEREARERDPAISARARAIGLTIFAALSTILVAIAFLQQRAMTPLDHLLYPPIVLGAVLIGGFFLRRAIAANLFNRQIFVVLIALLGFWIVGRFLGLAGDAPDADHFRRDMLLFSGMLTIVAIAHLRWAIWIAALMLAGSVATVFLPEHSLRIFGATAGLSLLTAALFSWRSGRERA